MRRATVLARAARATLQRRALGLAVILQLACGGGFAAVGIAAHHAVAGQMRDDAGSLFHVQVLPGAHALAAGARARAAQPTTLGYRDLEALWGSGIPSREAATFAAVLPLSATSASEQASTVRFIRGSFFALFEPTFTAGGPWTEGRAPFPRAAVLEAKAAARLFGPEARAAIAQTISVRGIPLEVVGVVDSPVVLSPVYAAFASPRAELFVPFELADVLSPEPQPLLDTGSAWTSAAARLASPDALWIGYWVELANPRDHERFAARLEAVGLSRAADGGVQAALESLEDWNARHPAPLAEFRYLRVVGLLTLAAAALGSTRLHWARLLPRAAEVALRRALGARRLGLWAEFMVEAALLALPAAALAVCFGAVLLGVIDAMMPASAAVFGLEPAAAAAAFAACFGCGLLAAAAPAWRVATTRPGDPGARR